MKQWKRVLSLILAGVMGLGAVPASAAESVTRPLGLEDIKAIQAYVHDGGYAGPGNVSDLDGDGVIDVFDLALAKRAVSESGAPSLTELSADIWDVYLGEKTSVTFTVRVTEVAPLAEGAVTLCDESGAEVAVMHDDGADGDETAGDSIYTARPTLTGEAIGTVAYHAQSMGAVSEEAEIAFYREIADGEKASFEALFTKLDAMSFEDACAYAKVCDEITSFDADKAQQILFYETVYHINGMWVPTEWRVKADNAVTDTSAAVGEKVTQDPTEPPSLRIASAYAATAQGTVSAEVDENLPGPDPFDVTEMSDGSPYMVDKDGVLCEFFTEKYGEMDYPEGLDPQSRASGKTKMLGKGKNKVAVICPFYEEIADEDHALYDANELADRLGSGSASVFKDTSWFGVSNEVTLEQMKQLGDYGIVIVSTKSYRKKTDIYGEEYLMLGTESKWAADDADIQSGRVAITSLSFLTCRYAVGKGFFEKYYGKKSLNNSFWYISSPGAMGNETKANSGIADTLIGLGASAVVGYNSQISDSSDANRLTDSILNTLWNGKTLAQALQQLSRTDRAAVVLTGKKTYQIADQKPAIRTGNMYWEVGTVHASPGQRVTVPIYVYHDVGTYGLAMELYIDGQRAWLYPPYDAYQNWKALCPFRLVAKWMPAQIAPDGSIIAYACLKVPTDTAPGTQVDITIEAPIAYCADGTTFTPTVYSGAVIVDEG